MSFKGLFITAVVVGLFLVALVNFGVYFAQNNGQNSTLLEDENVARAFANAQQQIQNASDESNSSRTAFERGQLQEEGDGIVITAIKGVGTAFGGTISLFFNTIFNLVAPIVPAQVLAVIGLIIGAILVFYAWRLYRAGE